MASFELTTLDQEDTTVIELLHPENGDSLGATITIYGQDSDVYQSASRKQTKRIREYARRHKGSIPEVDELEKMEKQKIVACVTAVDGLVVNGSQVTKETIEAVFDKYVWIYEQVSAAVVNRGLFMKG